LTQRREGAEFRKVVDRQNQSVEKPRIAQINADKESSSRYQNRPVLSATIREIRG
jgi:hypothetical protein